MASKSLNFFNMSNTPDSILPKSFDHKRKKYSFSYDDNGVRYLKVVQEYDIQSDIQAFANDCNIYNILNRYIYGDANALNQTRASYGDFSNVPTTLQEALNISLRLKQDFNNLKPEIKSEFNNDFNQYLVSVSNGKVFDIFKKHNVSIDSKVNLGDVMAKYKAEHPECFDDAAAKAAADKEV